MVYSGAWEKLIHEKNQMSKISWHCPFNPTEWLGGVKVEKVWSIAKVILRPLDLRII